LVAFFALGFPLAAAVLFLLVRIAPFLVSPPLVLRQPGHVYGLGLGAQSGSHEHDERPNT
jgi:hypothetical protein